MELGDTLCDEVFDSEESDDLYDDMDDDCLYDNRIDRFQHKTELMGIKDIIMDKVLPILPAKTLIRFRSVSKQWDSWITSPLFAHHQSYSFKDLSGFFTQYRGNPPSFLTLNRSSYGVPKPSLDFLPDSVTQMTSSNGLILCQSWNDDRIYFVCNPSINNWRQIPPPSYYHGCQPATILAFEPSLLNVGANYHLICAFSIAGQPFIFFEIYSSETRSWRCSETICIELKGSSFTGQRFYRNGIAYWLTSRNEVLAFDLESEISGVIPLPPDCPRDGILATVKDELCYIGISCRAFDAQSITIYGGLDLCRLRYKIDLAIKTVSSPDSWAVQPRVLPFVRDEKVVFIVEHNIYSYSLSDETLEVMMSSLESSYFDNPSRCLPYVNSLVSVA